MKMLSDFEIGWLSALVDGEGCITILKCMQPRDYGDKKYFYYPIHVSIGNTNYELLEKAQSLIGGRIYEQKTVGNRKQGYHLVLYRRSEVGDLLKILAPHLIVKRGQVELALQFLALGKSFNSRLRAEMQVQMKAFNKRGVVEQNGPRLDDSHKDLQ